MKLKQNVQERIFNRELKCQNWFEIVIIAAYLWIILHDMVIEKERNDNDLANDVCYDIGRNTPTPEFHAGLFPNYYAYCLSQK